MAGSPASAFVEWLVPRPDVMLLPDAPAELITPANPNAHCPNSGASKNSSGPLLAEAPAATRTSLSTSGQEADATQPVVRAVLSAAHLGSPPRP